MVTPLNRTLKRAIKVDGADYIVQLSEGGLKLTRKGKRLGLALAWKDLLSGDAGLAAALRASVTTGLPRKRFSRKQKSRSDRQPRNTRKTQ